MAGMGEKGARAGARAATREQALARPYASGRSRPHGWRGARRALPWALLGLALVVEGWPASSGGRVPCKGEKVLFEGKCRPRSEVEAIQKRKTLEEAERQRRAAEEAERKRKTLEEAERQRPRFVDNGDGTVTDRKTRLVWSRKNFGGMPWRDAVEYCRSNRAGLPGTGWHLPTIDELRTLIIGCPATEPGGRCPVRQGCQSEDDCYGGDWERNCAPCELRKGSGPDGCYMADGFEDPCKWYWSSTPVPWSSSSAFFVLFFSGYVSFDLIGDGNGVRCVRAGQ